MGHNCDCGHHCHDDENENTSEESSEAMALANKKVESLKNAIRKLGYKVEETPEGEIKVTE